jgi:hypothetical protein
MSAWEFQNRIEGVHESGPDSICCVWVWEVEYALLFGGNVEYQMSIVKKIWKFAIAVSNPPLTPASERCRYC